MKLISFFLYIVCKQKETIIFLKYLDKYMKLV